MQLFIAPTGEVRCLYGEALDLAAIGRVAIHRASHVEPTEVGLWTADLSPIGGPLMGPFAHRTEALDAEARWLNDHLERSAS
jgi:hypothetical protein